MKKGLRLNPNVFEPDEDDSANYVRQNGMKDCSNADHEKFETHAKLPATFKFNTVSSAFVIQYHE